MRNTVCRSAAALALLLVASCSPDQGGSLSPEWPGAIDIEIPSSTPSPGPTPPVAQFCEPLAPTASDLVVDAPGVPGTVDETFDPSLGVYTVRAIAEQRDGKILYSGQEMMDRAVCRLDRDGRSDPTFGESGCALAPLSGMAIAIDDNGRILVGGRQSDTLDIVVSRFTSDGQTDETFGRGGTVAFPDDGADGIRLDAAGEKTLVSISNSSGSFVAQLNHDGTLDTAFGSGGILLGTRILNRLSDCGLAVADMGIRILGMNGVVDESFPALSGWTVVEARGGDLVVPRENSIARYTRGGSLVSTTPVGSSRARHFALDGGDRLVQLGDVWVPDAYIEFFVARRLSDGSPDSTFGEDGYQRFSGGSHMFQLLVLRDGRYLVAGTLGDFSPTLVRIWN